MNKKGIIFVLFLVAFLLISPFKVKAVSGDELFNCQYSVNVNDKKVDLIYHVLNGNKVKLAYEDGTDLLNNGLTWYHSVDFSAEFLKASILGENKYTCPVLMVDKNNKDVTVFSKLKYDDSCNGVCAKLRAKNINVRDNSIKSNMVTDSCVTTAVGIYNSTSYRFIYFRQLDNGAKQWSIDGANYTAITNKWSIKVDGVTHQIAVNNDLIKHVYDSSTLACSNIYRCVGSTNGVYNYELSSDVNKCKDNSLGNNDGQVSGSLSYNGSQGAASNRGGNNNTNPLTNNGNVTCTGNNSLLGNPSDPDSVAWLVQKILNYIKIAGPMLVIIFSSIDYLRALIQSDEETMAKLNKKLITRIVLTLLLFFVPLLVNVLLDLFGMDNSQTCNLE